MGYRPGAKPRLVLCRNCGLDDWHRGRGLCPRCYQFLWRTGTLPPPNGVSVEEVLGDEPVAKGA